MARTYASRTNLRTRPTTWPTRPRAGISSRRRRRCRHHLWRRWRACTRRTCRCLSAAKHVVLLPGCFHFPAFAPPPSTSKIMGAASGESILIFIVCGCNWHGIQSGWRKTKTNAFSYLPGSGDLSGDLKDDTACARETKLHSARSSRATYSASVVDNVIHLRVRRTCSTGGRTPQCRYLPRYYGLPSASPLLKRRRQPSIESFRRELA